MRVFSNKQLPLLDLMYKKLKHSLKNGLMFKSYGFLFIYNLSSATSYKLQIFLFHQVSDVNAVFDLYLHQVISKNYYLVPFFRVQHNSGWIAWWKQTERSNTVGLQSSHCCYFDVLSFLQFVKGPIYSFPNLVVQKNPQHPESISPTLILQKARVRNPVQ